MLFILIAALVGIVVLMCVAFITIGIENESSYRVVVRNKKYYVQKKNDFSSWDDMIKTIRRSIGEMHIEYYSFTDKKSAIQCAKEFAENDRPNKVKTKEKVVSYF